MADLEDRHDPFSVVDGISNPVIALPHSMPIIVAGQLLAPMRAGVATQTLYSSGKPLAISLLSDRPQFLGSRALDVNSISCHAVSWP